MAEYELECHGCGEMFTAKSPRAKWHTPACKKRKQRNPDPTEQDAERPASQVDPIDLAQDSVLDAHPLVAATKRDLISANALDTFHGQLAIALAKRVATPGESGVSAIAGQLQSAMAAATGVTPGGAPAEEPPAEDDDEVTRARKAREEARQAAGLT